MPDHPPDPEFRRHVTVVAHTLALRSFALRHPEATRGTAWEHACQNWQEFLVRAVVFVVARGFREVGLGLDRE